MATQPPRFLNLSADIFDGTTPLDKSTFVSSVGNVDGTISGNIPRLYAEQENIGHLSYEALFETGAIAGLVQVRVSGGPTAADDRLEVRTPLTTEQPTGENMPTDKLQKTVLLTADWSAPFMIEPRDAIELFHRPSASPGGITLIVTPLDEEAYLAWIMGGGGGSPTADTCCDVSAVTMTATGTVQSFDGTLFVTLTPAADATITLPPIAEVPEGRKIIFIRQSGAGIPTIVPNGVGDLVNGSTTTEMTRYFMRSLQDSVIYTRVANGWQREQGFGVAPVQSGATPINVRAQYEGTQYVVASPLAGGLVNLPALSTCRAGYRVVVFNASTDTFLSITSSGTDLIDGFDTASIPYPVPPQARVMLELTDTATGGQWVTISSNDANYETRSALSPVNLDPWRGIEPFQLLLSNSAGTVNLPAVADVEFGAKLIVRNTGTGSITVVPDGTEDINGASSRVVWQGQACLLVAGTSGWHAVGGVNQPTNIVDGTNDPVPVAAWVDSPQYVETTGAANQTVQLPAAAAVAQGAELIHFNNSVNQHDIARAGADTINGGAGPFVVAAGKRVIVRRVSSTGWITILTA